jgi:Cupin domain
MRYMRLYADASGQTHFADVDIELHEAAYAPPAPPFFVSEPSPATAVAWTTIPKGWSSGWHPTPRLQWWFQLVGEVEVSTGDGETRRLGPGSIVRLEDVGSRGHTTRVVGDEDVVAVYAHIPE